MGRVLFPKDTGGKKKPSNQAVYLPVFPCVHDNYINIVVMNTSQRCIYAKFNAFDTDAEVEHHQHQVGIGTLFATVLER